MTETPVACARRALDFVESGQTLGLGTGRAATAFVVELGRRVADGFRVRAVATSEATAAVAREWSIPLLELDEAGRLDVTIDGADEVDPQLEMIKGYGGALVREKITAASSKRLVILVGPEKMVSRLGERGKLPVEVVPFGVGLCSARLRELGCEPVLRQGADGRPFLTDNGNPILDCRIGPLPDPAAFESQVLAIPGTVGTGLFVGMADVVIVDRESGPEVLERSRD